MDIKTIKYNGFALLEVLIALVIIAIGIISLIQTTTTSVYNLHYLEQKTEAQWVATNIANEIQIGMIGLPQTLDNIHGTMMLLNHQWFWSAQFEVTADHSALRTTIDVKPQENAASILKYVTFLTPSVAENP